MTRKDYVLLARHLSDAYPVDTTASDTNQQKVTVWYKTVEAVADALAEDNPRFNREKFLLAVTDQ